MIRRWLHLEVFPVLDRAWVQGLAHALAILTGVRFFPGSVRPFALDPFTILTLTLDWFDCGGLYGTVMILAQVDAQPGIEEEAMFYFG